MNGIQLGWTVRLALLLMIMASAGIPLGVSAFEKGGYTKQREYIVATGYAGGTYYHAGLAIATQIDVRSDPPSGLGWLRWQRRAGGATSELLRRMRSELALVQALAVEELLPKPAGWFRRPSLIASIGWLWQNVEHFLLREEFVKEGTLSDIAALSEQPVYLGAEDSGTLLSTRFLLESIGLPIPAETADVSSYDAAADALIGGKIVFASLPGGDPVSSVSRAISALGPSVRMLSVTDEQYEQVSKGLDALASIHYPTGYLCPAGTAG